VTREMAAANSFEGQLLRDYGLQVTALDDVSRRYFNTEKGVVVREVVDGQQADAARLTPGDVITGLDKSPVGAPEDLRPLVVTGDHPAFQLEVRRNRRIVRMELKPGAAHASGELHGTEYRGIGLAESAPGYLVGTVARGSRAERASIQAGDRLLLVDGSRNKIGTRYLWCSAADRAGLERF